ncbi:putative ribonuclease H-like domain-containing protein [Tanacetum coccineum]
MLMENCLEEEAMIMMLLELLYLLTNRWCRYGRTHGFCASMDKKMVKRNNAGVVYALFQWAKGSKEDATGELLEELYANTKALLVVEYPSKYPSADLPSNFPKESKMAEHDTPPPTITAMKIPVIKKGEYDIWSMRMRQYICHTDHNLWDMIINEDQEDEPMLNLSGKLSRQGLEKLISQLEVYGAVVAKEDINQKFLRSLPPAWNQIALIMRNKPDIDNLDIDDLYNNLKVYEDEMKSSNSSTTSQNLAFLSSENTKSIASGDFGKNNARGINQNDDFKQLDRDDLEELDIRWQIAMLTVRAQNFMQGTGRKVDFKEKRSVALDKSKVFCYNCHRKGHFARECMSGKNQGKITNDDKSKTSTTESSSQALVAQDGLGGYDWSDDFDLEPVNYALLAFSSSGSSSSSDNKVNNCSKQCIESFKSLKKNLDDERAKHSKAKLEIRDIKIENLKAELEKVTKERDELKSLTVSWNASSRHLNLMANNQMSSRDKNGLGYGEEIRSNSETNSEISLSVFDTRSSDVKNTPENDMFPKDGFHAVPPPITGEFLTHRPDISFAGLDELAIRNKIIQEKSKSVSEPVESNKEKVIIEDWTSDNEDEVSVEPNVVPVRTEESQSNKTSLDKIGQTSKKQGSRIKKVKSCFVCKSTDHLIKDCNFYDKRSSVPKGKQSVKSAQRVNTSIWGVLVSSGTSYTVRPHVSTTRPKVSTARPKVSTDRLNVSTARPKVGTDSQNVSTNRPNISTTRPFVPNKAQSGSVHPRMDNGNPETLLQDHAVVDSAFGSDPKGGRITGRGKIKTANLDFDDVYFVDELKFNLFFVSQMCDKKTSVLFTENECLILSSSFKLLDESKVILRAPRKDDVYSLDLKNIVPSGGITCLYANARPDESKLWHMRLGHVNFKNINKLVKENLVRGLPSKVFINDHTCVACKKGKQRKASCKAKLERTIRKPLELLHMELFGPVSVDSINKKRYCLVVTDDYSRFSWVFFLATKDETSDILCTFIIGLENQLNHKVKIIRCDNGTEFKNHIMNEFCAKKGIKREFSVAKTPQQNGVAERKNRTLIEGARTMLADSLLPIPFWAEAVNTACYVLNRSDEGYLLGYSTTSKAFRVYNKRTKRVEENLHIDFLEDQPNVVGKGPDWMFNLDFLTNSINYIPVSIENQVTVDAGVQEIDIAGTLEKNNEVAQEYVLHPQKIKTPMNAAVQGAHEKPSENDKNSINDAARLEFKEEKRKNASSKEAVLSTDTNLLSTDRPNVSTNKPIVSTDRPNDSTASTNSTTHDDLSFGTNMTDEFSNQGIFSGAYDDEDVGAEVDFNNMDNTIVVSPIPTLKIHKVHPKEQILGDPKLAVQIRRNITKASSAQQALISYIHKQNRTNHKDHQNCLLACFLSQEEPKTIAQALLDKSWVEAMQEELLQFKLQKVWVLVNLPYGKKVISIKWVFRNKKDERSIVVKNKARLVAQGFRQEEGIDYDEVFAPVARIEAIRLFLAFASYIGFTVYQIDVKSAFLYVTINEDVYVHQPPGFADPAHPHKVYKVVKALNGLHQAPRAWYEKLSSFLIENGFRRGTIDNTLFIKRNKKDIMLVQVYVDDIIFGSTKQSMCTEFEECMHNRFQISYMGELTFFLGLQVKQQKDGIFISQDKYVVDILKKFNFWSIRTATTPIESNKPLVKDEEGEDVDVHLYRSMIGSLIYLTASRPDIMFVVCTCARFQVTPKVSHLNAVKRIFRYLKHQPKLGLWYPKDSPFDLEAYFDSDYGRASLDRKSTTGGCQFLGRRLISWQCKKQTIVANSTTKAEYVAAAHCCGQVLWIQN